MYSKLRRITRPAIAIRQKLANSKITRVNTYGKLMVIIRIFELTHPVFRLKKVLTQIRICVSMCEILGTRANSIQSRNRDLCEHDSGLSFLSFDLT